MSIRIVFSPEFASTAEMIAWIDSLVATLTRRDPDEKPGILADVDLDYSETGDRVRVESLAISVGNLKLRYTPDGRS